MGDLPVELWHMVFSTLATYPTGHSPVDKESYNEIKSYISSCTLVCRRWCDIARPYLFQDVRLTLENKDLEQIHEHFLNSPLFSSFIKRLHLDRYDRSPRSPHVTRDGAPLDTSPSPKLSIILLADTLRLFPKLRHLRLVDIFFPNLTVHDVMFLQETRAGKLAVEVLEIVFNICFLDYASRQRHILACFGSVDQLLVCGRAHWSDGPSSRTQLCVPQVRALELADAAATHQMLTLLRTPSHGECHLEEISIERINSGMTDEYPALQKMLDVVGSRLLHFRCNMARNPQDILLEGYFPARPIDLTPCTKLQSLTLGFQLPASRASSAEVWSSVVETLTMLERQLVLPPLRTLTLEVDLMDVDGASWREPLQAAVADSRSAPAHNAMATVLQGKVAELGIPAVEPLLLSLCHRVKLSGVVFSSPPHGVFSLEYRASLALCFPELRARGLLKYQERGSRGEEGTEVL